MAVTGAWHRRWLQPTVYTATTMAGVIIALTAASVVEARQLYGLWALAFLLGSMIVGPLVAVAPWLPLKGHLISARRPIGVSTFVFVLAHVGCYLVPTLIRDWHRLFTPGTIWIIGLVLGLTALTVMAPLAWTSRDVSVASLGRARWRRLHRLVYLILPIVLLHALLVGSDFGAHRALDVAAQPDDGSLFVFLGLSLCWLVLVVWRARQRGRPS